jgi:hypothetical protein
MAAAVVVATAELADEGAILFNQKPTASVARGTTKPRTEALSVAEGPFLMLDLHDVCSTTVGEGNLRVTSKTSNPDTWVVLQELTVAPFPWPRCPKGCGHNCEKNLRAFDGSRAL